ncbi:RING/leucine zipper protein [Cavenderia fasciculata]|uniref:RING/leucine zipper protein n=1 Tax=Cavenderia fasciculata TaxID=261658 RepID=F4PMK9_CACFS|nr:RING/leucine zipper protein [Cavenderia fasciculata]EGG23656.1 RING/leucine zipper protein [Cavenderia fasciculata]|eukprot:XP_004361507.1 RING/leucine zipper protein [Cavenderia fasciculata]
MDPLDPEYSYKFLTDGAPLKLEKLLDIEVKPGAFKTASLIGTITVGVVAGAAAAYYWLNRPEDEESDDEGGSGGSINDEDAIITTTTTTTTTTSYFPPPPPIINGGPPIQRSIHTPLPPRLHSHACPSKLLKDNGEPLPIEEQNRLLLNENRTLRRDVDNLNTFVTEKMASIEKKLESYDKTIRDLESELDKERFCFICQENEKQVCWTGCGHRLCGRCAIVIKSSGGQPVCPMCRKPVDTFVRCYNS